MLIFPLLHSYDPDECGIWIGLKYYFCVLDLASIVTDPSLYPDGSPLLKIFSDISVSNSY
jgi:hypothetical protein